MESKRALAVSKTMSVTSDERREVRSMQNFVKSSASLRSLDLGNAGKSQRKIYLIFLTCVGLVTVSLFYANSQVSVFSRSNVDERGLMTDFLLAFSSVGGKNSAAISKFIAAGADEGENTDITRRAIAGYLKIESDRAEASSVVSTNETVASENACGNSERWLTGPRYGNLDDDPFLTNDLAQHMILNLEKVLQKDSTMPAVLGQSICHPSSRFLNDTQPAEVSYDDRTVRLWAVKLIYLAVHYHQHRLAVPEVVARYKSGKSQCPSPIQLKQEHGVGIFDYECPDAKYIVMPLCGNGLGSNVRGGMVLALLMGLISDRIVVFVNNAKRGNAFLQSKWPLASCPRKDYQCFFWATTPCTLTQEEIHKAYSLTKLEYKELMKRNKRPKNIDHHKVWTFNSQFMPLVVLPGRAAETLYQYARKLIAAVPEATNPGYAALLKKAAETILVADPPRDGYSYAGATMKVHHALAFYSMRPNPRNAHELDRIVTDIIPSNFRPENSVGLPIRGSSDKAGCDLLISGRLRTF